MLYVIVENHSVIFGPSEWNRLLFQSILSEELEISHNLDFIDPNSSVIINDSVSILPVVNTEIQYDESTENLVGPFWKFENNTAIKSYTKEEKPIHIMKDHLKAMVSDNRYKEELKGIKLNINDTEVSIPTDRNGKNIFFNQLSIATEESILWKFNNDIWIPLNKQYFQLICTEISNYIQKLYDWENTKFVEIDSKTTVEELASVILTYPEETTQG